MTLDPDADSWDLPIVGYRVVQVWFSGQLYVIAENDRSGWTFADFPKGIPETKTAAATPTTPPTTTSPKKSKQQK